MAMASTYLNLKCELIGRFRTSNENMIFTSCMDKLERNKFGAVIHGHPSFTSKSVRKDNYGETSFNCGRVRCMHVFV